MRKLFRKTVPDDLINKVVSALGFRGMNDRCEVGFKSLLKEQMSEVLSELWPYYTPCYAKIFLVPDRRKFVTVSRQLLRLKGASLHQRKVKGRCTFYSLSLPEPPPPQFEVEFL